MESYCVVYHTKWKETGRSKPLPIATAISRIRQLNRAAGKPVAYIETASSVRHLPIVSSPTHRS